MPGSSLRLDDWLTRSMDRWGKQLGPSATLAREGEALPLTAWLDPKIFNLITDNIIDNARKFARGKPELVIATRRLRERRSLLDRVRGRPMRTWQIEFRDNGWGFPPSDARRLFHPFFRSRTLAPHAIPGTGLGLYLVASACRAQGLTIRAESAGVGTGASFVLEGSDV